MLSAAVDAPWRAGKGLYVYGHCRQKAYTVRLQGLVGADKLLGYMVPALFKGNP
jgi:hypothetical protein